MSWDSHMSHLQKMSHLQNKCDGLSENQDGDDDFFQEIVERMRVDIELKAEYYRHEYSTVTRQTPWADDRNLNSTSSARKYSRRHSNKASYSNLAAHACRKLTMNWKHRTPFVFTIPSSTLTGVIKAGLKIDTQ